MRLIALSILMLAACATSPEIQRLEALEAAGNYTAIAETRPTCQLMGPDCINQYRYVASACLRLSPGNAIRADCADQRFAALFAVTRSNDDLLGRLEAIRQARESVQNGAMARARNDSLQALAPQASGPWRGFYSAESLGWAIAFAGAPADCPTLAAARADAAQAANSPPPPSLNLQPAARQLDRDLARRQTANGCTP